MINLLPRKEFEITLSDGTVIKGKFGTWALKRVTDKNKTSLQESGALLQTLSGLLDYIKAAVEYNFIKKGETCPYNDVDVADWIDEIGGISSENMNLLVRHMSEETEEKKTETPAS